MVGNFFLWQFDILKTLINHFRKHVQYSETICGIFLDSFLSPSQIQQQRGHPERFQLSLPPPPSYIFQGVSHFNRGFGRQQSLCDSSAWTSSCRITDFQDRVQINHINNCGNVKKNGLFPVITLYQRDVFSIFKCHGDMLIVKTITKTYDQRGREVGGYSGIEKW